MPRAKEQPKTRGRQKTTRQATEPAGNEGAIWSRLIGPQRPTLSAAVARSILELEFLPEDEARMRELGAKARMGSVTPAEQEEIENYSRVGSILGLMKSKARVSLKKNSRS